MGGMGTGSDTRMYNPKSDAARSYVGDDEEDYRYGPGDPKEMDERRQKLREQREEDKMRDLPHLKVEVEQPEMGEEGPPPLVPPEEEEEPVMNDDENAVGAEVSQLTGAPGSMGAQLDQAIGAKTGTGSAMGGYRPLLATSYPMDNAWSELMKRQKNPWQSQEPKFDPAPGGRQPHTANPRREKLISRVLSGYSSGSGQDEAPQSVERTHQQRSVIHPMAQSEPAKYRAFQGQQQQRAIRQNIPMPYAAGASKGTYGQRSNLAGAIRGTPGAASQKHGFGAMHLPQVTRGPGVKTPSMSMAAVKSEVKELGDVIKKMNLQQLLSQNKSPANYLHFSQIRSMLRRMKDLMESNEKRLKSKASFHPKHNEGGHRDGGTTRPEGGTEDLENDPKNWGAPSTILVGRGSGRVA